MEAILNLQSTNLGVVLGLQNVSNTRLDGLAKILTTMWNIPAKITMIRECFREDVVLLIRD